MGVPEWPATQGVKFGDAELSLSYQNEPAKKGWHNLVFGAESSLDEGPSVNVRTVPRRLSGAETDVLVIAAVASTEPRIPNGDQANVELRFPGLHYPPHEGEEARYLDAIRAAADSALAALVTINQTIGAQ